MFIGTLCISCADCSFLMFKTAHLCIHSVVTAPQYQRKGIARQAMLNYVKHIRESEKQIKRISLIAKASKTGLYESCGFRMLGISAVVHGADVWHELTLEL